LGVTTLKLARYLANEVAYRGFREQSLPFLGIRGRGSRGFSGVSVIKSNILSSILFSLVSISASAVVALGNPVAYAVSATILAGVSIAMALMYVTPFTSTVIREGIIDLLRTLPITPSQVLKTYLTALMLYWGGLSVTFFYIPYLVVSTYYVLVGTLGIQELLLALLAFTTSLLFSYLLGIALGTYSYVVRRRAVLRYVTAIAWALTFLIVYLMFSITSHITTLIKSSTHLGMLELVGPYIPFVGPLFSYLVSPQLLTLSVIESLAIVVATYFVGRGRLASVILHGAEYRVPTKVVKAPVTSVKPKPYLLGIVRKDLKVLLREPRRLGSMIVMMVFPLVIGFTMFSKEPILSSALITSFVGAFSGLSVEYLYYAEGSGAQLLYLLPIRKRDVAISKSLATSVITSPISLAIATTFSLLKVGNVVTSLALGTSAAALSLGYSLINSALIINSVPKEPSYWNELTFRRSLSSRLVRTLVAIVGVGASVAIPLILMLMGLGNEVSKVVTAVGTYALATLVIGSLMIKYLVKGNVLSS